jgi:hypothetical protein
MIVFKTSMGPANVLDLSWSLQTDKMERISSMIDVDALDLDEFKWNDDEGFGGSLK